MNFAYCPKCGHKDTIQKLDETNYECTNCQWHFWNNAKAAVALALVHDGKLLTVKRGHEPRKGMLELAGGFVDFGESAQEAAIREAREELGITIHPDDLQLIAAYKNPYNPGVFTVYITFLVTNWQGTLRPGDDVAGVVWKPFNVIYDPEFCQKHYTGLDKVITAKLAKED